MQGTTARLAHLPLKPGHTAAPASPLTLEAHPVRDVPPAVVARRAVEPNTPRVVAAFGGGGNELGCPMFVLEDGSVLLWDVERDVLSLLSSRRPWSKPSPTTCGAFAPGCRVVATGHQSGQVRLQRLEWNSRSLEWRLRVVATIEAHRGRVWSLAATESRLLSAGSDGALVLTTLPGASPVALARSSSQVVVEGQSALSCLAVSPDGHLLALGGDDGEVAVWHLAPEEAQARREWRRHPNSSPVKSLVFAANSNLLISSHRSGSLCLWAARTGHELQVVADNQSVAPAFAPNSRLLALVNADNGIDLFDAWTGLLRHTLPPLRGQVQALVFSPALAASSPVLVVAGSQELLAWKVVL